MTETVTGENTADTDVPGAVSTDAPTSTDAPGSSDAGGSDAPAALASADEPAPAPTFADVGVHPQIVAALADVGITHPFPIQAMTMPVALTGHDIIGQAKTGTGKTLGFGVPLLHKIVAPGDPGFASLRHPGRPQALVVVPTRELCTQVTNDLKNAGRLRGIRVESIYGGRAFEPQVEALKRGVEVVVGTPGRLIDLNQQGHLVLFDVRTVVLDEADEMLDLGFLPDVEKILAQTPASRQTMLFSATMPGAVVALARRYMSQPTHIRALSEGDDKQTVAAIEQFVYRAHALDKVELLSRVLQAKGRGLTIIFTRTKRTAAKVADELTDRGFAAAAIHGDLGQGAREQALRAFRNGKVDILVATDVAARGIDVANVTHVVNYQCPEDEKTYLHRTGRTGRAGQTGVAITLVDWDDMPRWGLINKALDLGIPSPEETYSSSDHLYTDLDIDPAVTGRLPKSARTRAGLEAEELEDLGETGRSGGRRPAGHGRDHRGRDDKGRDGRDDGGRRSGRSSRSRGGASRGDTADSPRSTGAEPDGTPRARRSRRRTRGGRPLGADSGESNGGESNGSQSSGSQSSAGTDA